MDLFNDGPCASNDLVINKGFAEKYEKKKRGEELSALREKYGNGNAEQLLNDSDDSEDTDEDEYGQDLTPEVDAQILRTIAAIRNKDSRIYDPKADFFDASQLKKTRQDARAQRAEKPMYLKDYHRETLLQGQIPGAIQEDKNATKQPMTHVEEQARLKAEFKAAAAKAQTEDDGLLMPRVKSDEEAKVEEEEYRSWLLSTLKSEQNCQSAFKDWLDHQERDRQNLDEKDRFLMDYIFNRGWVNKEDDHIPSYTEIIGEIDDDEQAVEAAEEFETKYNFRFEEMEALNGAGSSYANTAITTHAREIPDAVRRKDTRRAEERQRRKERKEEEKLKTLEGLKRFNNLKKKETLEKLQKVQALSGINDEDRLEQVLEGIDLDGDFNPDEWDAKMQTLFNDDYYQDGADAVKPKFSDDEEVEGDELLADAEKPAVAAKLFKEKLKDINMDEYEFNGESGDEDVVEFFGGSDDDDFCMDADAIDEPVKDSSSNEPEKKEKKKWKKLEKYLDDYYKLDYEDILGDMRTRFRYRQVEKDTFGLKSEDILRADDKTLNEYLSLKKLAPYRNRPRDVEWLQNWRRGSKNRRRDFRKKLKAEMEAKEAELIRKKKKSKRSTEEQSLSKSKKKSRKDSAKDSDGTEIKQEKRKRMDDHDDVADQKKKKRSSEKDQSEKKHDRVMDGSSTKKKKRSVDTDRLAAYGITE